MVGEINKNTNGTEMIIINEKNYDDIDVEFLDEHHYIKQHTTYTNFKRGQIKNPFDKVVFGMGYLGVGKKATDDEEAYKCWWNMVERCYNSSRSDLHPAYYGISKMSGEWLNFQNFAKWFEENRYECKGRLHLDKDIKYHGNKIYSPYHCILVPQVINEQFKNNTRKKEDLDLPYTIRRKGSNYTVSYAGNKLGKYKTVQEAIRAYEEARYERILSLINDYPNMPNNVKEVLVNIKSNWTVA